MNDSKDSEDAESIPSGNSSVTSRPVSFPLHPVLGGMLKHSGHTWFFVNVFADPLASLSALCLQKLQERSERLE